MKTEEEIKGLRRELCAILSDIGRRVNNLTEIELGEHIAHEEIRTNREIRVLNWVLDEKVEADFKEVEE